MAPLDFDGSINVASLAGTWMGTIFTGLGLLAVLTQLRSLLLYVKAENWRWKERTAGAWADCILVDHLPSNNGIQEGAVPVFSGWLQNFYVHGKTITVSQDDREMSGKSSWSDLFARMDIKAADLNAYGGLRRQFPVATQNPSVTSDVPGIRALRPGLGDVLVENGSVSYGFSAAEFAALVIICGFSPGDFAPKSSRRSTSWYGQLLVADYSNFSQIAKFDSHHGFRDAIRSFKIDMCEIPVAHSLNLAFGMIRVQGRRGRAWVIPCESATPLRREDPLSSLREVWGAYMSPQQLRKIQYSFERFVGTGELVVTDYSQTNEIFEVEDIMVLKDLISSSGLVLQLADDDIRARAREFLNATHAIAAIRPWGLRPILPGHIIIAIMSILDPFYKTRAIAISILQRELTMIPGKTFRPEGRTSEELSLRLKLVNGDKDAFFGANNSQTSVYHEAMSLIFRYKNIRFDNVRVSLAAAVGTKLFSLRYGPQSGAETLERFEQSMRQYLERCYLQAEPEEKPQNVPDWAVDVYATYLWGWITSSEPGDSDLISYFRRRVFLA